MRLQILTFTTLYPSQVRPQHGIFVETRLRKLVERGAVTASVVAPCPWFPLASRWFGSYSLFARQPREEIRNGLRVDHPRYPPQPKIGMSVSPLAIFTALLPVLRRQLRAGRDFDLIDAHYFYPDGVAAVLLGRALGRPVVVTARGGDLDVIAEYAAPRRWIYWSARRADGLIAGCRAQRTAIEALARERRVADRVRLLGRLPEDRVPDICSAADLLLLVSTHEGWPNVLLESMACGTPVIVSDIDGIADLVGAPEAGRIVQEPTPDRLAIAARNFLAALPGRAATRAYAERFDRRSTTERQIALFREICKQRPGRRGAVHAA